MSAPAIAAGRPTVRIRGTAYPVLLPTWRDPRLHLAGVIVTLQVLGQTAFDFRLSIAQILVSLVTCAVLEVSIAFRRQHVLMWPASALLTGNGVAFVGVLQTARPKGTAGHVTQREPNVLITEDGRVVRMIIYPESELGEARADAERLAEERA